MQTVLEGVRSKMETAAGHVTSTLFAFRQQEIRRPFWSVSVFLSWILWDFSSFNRFYLI